MAKWRIKEVTYYPGTVDETKKYFVQKRLFGFLWWFDPYDDGYWSDGVFFSYEEALNRVKKELSYNKTSKIVWSNE